MEGLGTKRKSQHQFDGPHKAPKLAGGAGSQPKMSFAQKMMAKMGYVEGQGLGRDGEGIVKPIEVKLRPQGAGVGTVKEKTKQAKDEERRRAEMRGEEYEDSSDEERRKRKARQQKTQSGGHRTGGHAASTNKKPKYRTVADIQAAAPGLDVPPTMLSSILDMTGSDRKLLTSSAGLLLPAVAARDDAEIEREKLEKRERLEFDAFIDAWHGLQERKIYYEEHEGRHAVEILQMEDDLAAMKSLTAAVRELGIESPQQSWSILVDRLTALQELRELHNIKDNLHEAAVASLSAVFKLELEQWPALDSPGSFVADLSRLTGILGFDDAQLIDQVHQHDDDVQESLPPTSSTAYETMMYTVWLPKVRRVAQTWDVTDCQPLIELFHAWKPLLPKFVSVSFTEQTIVPRLKAALLDWTPGKRSQKKPTPYDNPSLWLFPWLPHLPPYQLDAHEPDSLASEVRRRLRSLLSGWRISAGPVPSLAAFKEFPERDYDHLMVKYLLPRLAAHIAREVDVVPAKQDMTSLEQVFAWQPHFKASILARLLAAEFFPKWLLALHQWLTAPDANFEEIGRWFQSWKAQIPAAIAQCADVVRGWQEAEKMINDALDLLDAEQPLSKLRAPAAGPSKPMTEATSKRSKVATSQPQVHNVDFRSIVEAWCAEHDLTLLPLREAHPSTGLPLLRITASASGKGGVIGYLKGDILWVQKKGDRTVYEPAGLDDKLVERAEGR